MKNYESEKVNMCHQNFLSKSDLWKVNCKANTISMIHNSIQSDVLWKAAKNMSCYYKKKNLSGSRTFEEERLSWKKISSPHKTKDQGAARVSEDRSQKERKDVSWHRNSWMMILCTDQLRLQRGLYSQNSGITTQNKNRENTTLHDSASRWWKNQSRTDWHECDSKCKSARRSTDTRTQCSETFQVLCHTRVVLIAEKKPSDWLKETRDLLSVTTIPRKGSEIMSMQSMHSTR